MKRGRKPKHPKVKEIREYLIEAMDSFKRDRADTPYLEGYEDALSEVYGNLFMTREQYAVLLRNLVNGAQS
jgi:hypothetical protein